LEGNMPRTLIAVCTLLASLSVGAATPVVVMKTSMGAITLELYPDRAPKTVKNFLKYANDGFYNGTIFHRVIDGFMIQGGGFTANLTAKKTRAPIPIESNNGLKNDAGAIAMARSRDPNSATSQFFINLVNNDSLNYPRPDGHGYTVFGKVIEGMEVVRRIGKVATGTRPPLRNVPLEPVVIESVKMLKTSSKTK